MSPVLDIRDLRLEIGRPRRAAPILRGVSLTVMPGQVHGLVGESGGGKTMVGRAAMGLQPRGARVTGGSIALLGRDVTRLPERDWRDLRGDRVAMILQDPLTALNPVRRIGAQITDVLRLHRGLSRRAAEDRAIELLEAVQMREPARVVRLYPHELSGGMRQRVVIAIAFSCHPALIIADEPTTALDVTVQKQVLRLIRGLCDRDTGLLFITHDLGVVAKLCDVVSVIHSGRIVEHGPVERIFAAPEHPYTRALFAATPRHDQPDQPLLPVPDDLIARLEAEAAAL